MYDPPSHVGLIPDGLRRWSRVNDVDLTDAYLRGAHKIVDVLVALQRLGVRTVSVYNLSRANLSRRDDELEPVFAASVQFFGTLLPARFDPAVCSVRLHGDRSALPEPYLAAARGAESALSGRGFTINVLAAYDARDELRNAHAKAGELGCDVNDAFDIGDVDLVIRTSPEPLLSGFLPMQCQYAHLQFLSTPLNDLEVEQVDDLVANYRRLPQLRGK
ncbi:undecaprenyl diphosphate synthase family protein [Mycolicibacterium hodleri]|uniref:undecaprenyl diphosphate synthase family protein n=1 Tax=Mycolicibacterium hodleri TaxID=49897 RepID=UPI0021F2A20F|nr:undecaprenyl diphosphate synthase family protein [Mycolicibacterium hodleri]